MNAPPSRRMHGHSEGLAPADTRARPGRLDLDDTWTDPHTEEELTHQECDLMALYYEMLTFGSGLRDACDRARGRRDPDAARLLIAAHSRHEASVREVRGLLGARSSGRRQGPGSYPSSRPFDAA